MTSEEGVPKGGIQKITPNSICQIMALNEKENGQIYYVDIKFPKGELKDILEYAKVI
jgi:hypothetical protein